MALIVLAAIGGAAGPGLFGECTVTSESGLRLRYDRFIRFEAPASLSLELRAGPSGRAEFYIDRSWLSAVHVETVEPHPERVTARDKRVEYTLAAEPKAAVHAIIHFEANTVGTLQGWIGARDGIELPLSQFAFP
jgi:hypothetical protein